MHASIWRFRGDPDELLRAYDAMAAEIPSANMKLHLCLRAPDGIIVVDTCPTKEAFLAFAERRAQLARFGLPEPEIDDFPVHVAFVAGQPATNADG